MSVPNLPFEIIEEILSRLPVKSLLRLSCVSKNWHTLLTTDHTFAIYHVERRPLDAANPSFIIQVQFGPALGLHDDLYYVPKGQVEKVVKLELPFVDHVANIRSSNGLVCFFDIWCSFIFLWNPATRQYKKLPNPEYEFLGLVSERCPRIMLGFGFDSTVKDYKVLRVNLVKDHVNQPWWSELQVYSLNTNSWRNIGVFPYKIRHVSTTVIDGGIHMAAEYSMDKDSGYFVLSFSLADDVLREIATPYKLEESHMYVGALKGCLAILVIKWESDTMKVITDVWVMNHYAGKGSWAKIHTLPGNALPPVGILENGEILINDVTCRTALVSYNSESGKRKSILIPGDYHKKGFNLDAVSYVESLVSL